MEQGPADFNVFSNIETAQDPESGQQHNHENANLRTESGNQQTIPRHVSDSVRFQARHIFLHDTVVLTPSSSAISRGHFANLAGLLHFAEPSALGAAVDAVALALLANRFSYHEVRPLAMVQYNSSVRHLQALDLKTTGSVQSLIACVTLLSLYEMLNASTLDSLTCVTHLDGLIAIMRQEHISERPPANGIRTLIMGTDSQGTIDPTSQGTAGSLSSGGEYVPSGLFSPRPTLTTSRPLDELVSITPKVTNLFRKVVSVLQPQSIRFEAQLTPLREEAIAIRSELLAWCVTQPVAIRPVTVERFTQPYQLLFPDSRELTCVTLRADSYPDRKCPLYVTEAVRRLTHETELLASMWNTYRQCQLHLADLICRIHDLLPGNLRVSHGKTEYTKLRDEIEGYIVDICASIPYMLAGDTICHCKPAGPSWVFPKPPMLLGGLSMQWRLFTIATLETAPVASKSHARDVLAWLGNNLGLGQAKVLAGMQENPGITAKGDALSWTGFLI